MLAASIHLLLISFLSLHIKHSSCGSDHDWTYRGITDGMQTWNHKFPDCGGKFQSPINIETKKIKVRNGMLKYEGFNTKPDVINVTNNGHSVNFDLKFGKKEPLLSGGHLPGTYFLKSFHFHWGSKSNRGSEHLINGKSFSMEMHAVFFNKKYHKIDRPYHLDEIAVLGFLFQTIPVNNNTNVGFQKILSILPYVRRKGSFLVLHNEDTFSFQSIFNEMEDFSMNQYYGYKGSLTTPGCHEVVTWTVFRQLFFISEMQINLFRQLLDEKKEYLADNYRGVQSLNGRVVALYTPKGQLDSNSGTVFSSANLLMLSQFVFFSIHKFRVSPT